VTKSAPEVAIGAVVAPHGIRGELRVKLLTDFPERFEELDEVWVEAPDKPGRMYELEGVRYHKEGVLIKLASVDDRNAAEDLRGAVLKIDEDQMVELEEGEFYIHDLIGLEVFTSEGTSLGKITDVLQGVANDVYVTPAGMIPALKQFVLEVDIEGRKMVVAPEGVLGE
jgi:16S rRNA processing protein RimM